MWQSCSNKNLPSAQRFYFCGCDRKKLPGRAHKKDNTKAAKEKETKETNSTPTNTTNTFNAIIAGSSFIPRALGLGRLRSRPGSTELRVLEPSRSRRYCGGGDRDAHLERGHLGESISQGSTQEVSLAHESRRQKTQAKKTDRYAQQLYQEHHPFRQQQCCQQ